MKKFSLILVMLTLVVFSMNSVVFSVANGQANPKDDTTKSSNTKQSYRYAKQNVDKQIQEDKEDTRKEIENEAISRPIVQPFVIKYGMRGESVSMVQTLLMELGFYADSVDGIFGGNTLEAVKQFQLTHELIPDGIVGISTLETMKRAEPIVNRNMRSFTMNASAYSAYDSGNSQYTSNGSFLRKGLVAVDPAYIPLGTRLYIPGYGYAIADDVGGSIKGNRIDLAFDSHSEALAFGRRNVVVYIVN